MTIKIEGKNLKLDCRPVTSSSVRPTGRYLDPFASSEVSSFIESPVLANMNEFKTSHLSPSSVNELTI